MLAIVYADGYLLGYGTEEDKAEKAVGYGPCGRRRTVRSVRIRVL